MTSSPDPGTSSRAYWLRRERIARALGERAADRHIARIHLDLADRYAAAAAEAAELPDPPS